MPRWIKTVVQDPWEDEEASLDKGGRRCPRIPVGLSAGEGRHPFQVYEGSGSLVEG